MTCLAETNSAIVSASSRGSRSSSAWSAVRRDMCVFMLASRFVTSPLSRSWSASIWVIRCW